MSAAALEMFWRKMDSSKFCNFLPEYDWMLEKNIENITKSDSNFAPTFFDHHLLPDMHFNGDCVIKSKISISKNVTNLYIAYTLNPQSII